MSTIHNGVKATLRLLMGASIVAAGIAVLLTLLYLRVTGTPLKPAMILFATFGVGLIVILAGGLMGLLHHGFHAGRPALPGHSAKSSLQIQR